jgi:biotin-[acetyl-CoA-carboxylase] ligase BirA-like protein
LRDKREESAHGQLVSDRRSCPPATDSATCSLDLAREDQFVAGFDDSLEAHIVDPCEERQLPAILRLGKNRDRPRLSKRLDHDHTGHDRPVREVPRKEPFVAANLLSGNDPHSRLELQNLVQKQEGLSVGNDLFDLCAAEWGRERCAVHAAYSNDVLSAEVVVPKLRGRFGHPYRYVERCASTQRLHDLEAPEGAVAVADEQTEGRGRLGRRWHAAPGTSLLVSIALRPAVEPARLPTLSLVAGEACAAAIAAATGLRPTVKFPNDLLIGGRKVAGILAEAREGQVVLGIGINVNAGQSELPAETHTPATSLSLETGRTIDRGELLVVLLEELECRYDAWVTAIPTA